MALNSVVRRCLFCWGFFSRSLLIWWYQDAHQLVTVHIHGMLKTNSERFPSSRSCSLLSLGPGLNPSPTPWWANRALMPGWPSHLWLTSQLSPKWNLISNIIFPVEVWLRRDKYYQWQWAREIVLNNLFMSSVSVCRDKSGLQRKMQKWSPDYTDGEFTWKRRSYPTDLVPSGNRGENAGSQV